MTLAEIFRLLLKAAETSLSLLKRDEHCLQLLNSADAVSKGKHAILNWPAEYSLADEKGIILLNNELCFNIGLMRQF